MKTTQEIYEEMKQGYAAASGLAVTDGGDMALRLYAAASQIYCLWVQADFVNRQAFPQTATGEYLDRHAQIRGLERGDATCATGVLRFFVDAAGDAAVPIPAGTACMTAVETEFVTTAGGEIPAGSLFCDVPAKAVASGSGGNVPAQSVTFMEMAPGGVSLCNNPAAFTGGSDPESDESLRGRVLTSYRKLPNGANAAYYETRAMDTDGVAAVSVLAKNRGIGTVDIIVAANDGVPSAELLSTVRQKLNDEREICVDLLVSPPETVTVNVTAALTVEPGRDYAAVALGVKNALTAYFTGRRLGEDVLRAKLGSIIFSVDGVKNYALTSPAADMTMAANKLPVAGTISLTEAQ